MNAARMFVESLSLRLTAPLANGEILFFASVGLTVLALTLLRHRPRRLRAVFLALTRGLALALLVLLLTRPILEIDVRTEWKKRLLVLIDDSASMTLDAGTGDGLSRFQHARAWLEQLPGLLGPDWQLRILRLGTDALAWSPGPARGGLTDLARGLFDDDAGRFAADAILLLSDGRVTRGTDLATVAGRLKTPVFAWACGGPLSLQDIAVTDIRMPEEAHAGEDVPLTATIMRRGIDETRLSVRLLDERGRELAHQLVEFPAGSDSVQVRLRWTAAEEGEHFVRLELPRLPNEQVSGNNSRHAAIQVRGQAQSAWLIASAPRFDSQALRRHYSERRGLRLHSMLVVRGELQNDRDGSGIPAEKPQLYILDDPDPTRWPPDLAGEIVRTVRAGAGLMLVAGPQSRLAGSDLESILPVSPGEYREGPVTIELTDQGNAHPLTRLSPSPRLNPLVFADFPRLTGRLAVEGSRPGALVLLREPQSRAPLLVCGRAGQGNVVVLLGDGLHRALLRPVLFARTRRHFGELLDRAVSWLLSADEEGFRLRSDRRVLEAGDLLHAFIDRPDSAECRLRLLAPDGRIVAGFQYPAGDSAPLIRESTVLRERGAYRLEAVHRGIRRTRRIQVEAPAREFVDPQPDTAELLRLCRSTGGHLLKATELNSLPALLPRPDRVERHRLSLELHGLPAAALLFFLLLALEWGMRRIWRLE